MNELAIELARQVGDQAMAQRLKAGDVSRAELEQWASHHREAVRARVRAALPPLPGLSERLQGLTLTRDGWHPTVGLGPATVGVDCPAAVAKVGSDLIVMGLLPPTGANAALAAGPVEGTGALSFSAEGMSGTFACRIGPIDAFAFAVLGDVDGTPSIQVVLGVRLLPPVQLSFGFALSAVGGVIGINRRIDGDALRGRLADGSALDALFPADPAKGAGGALAALAGIFPAQAGSHVVGPTFAVTWLDLGVTSVVRLDLGLLLQLPDPKVLLVGRGQVALPVTLALRLDVVGEIDPAGRVLAIDAVLVDSRALGIFRVTGTGALRLAWGDPPSVVFTLGGFYPGFRPEPPSIPPQQRLGLALDVPCPLSLRAEGYLAITSNTFQVGARIDAGIDLEVIEASGEIKFDAIVQFDPFHLHADYAAGWQVSVAVFSGGTTVSGWIDGPGPWTVHARVSIDLVFDDFPWSDTFTFGSPGPPPDPPIASLAGALAPELDAPSNLRAGGGDDPHVMVAPRPGGLAAGMALCSPLATLTWGQRLVPLELEVARVGGRRLAARQSVAVEVGTGVAQPAGPADDWFAPGTFLDLTLAEAMAIPPFQRLRAGTHLELASATSDSDAIASDDHESHYRRPSLTMAVRPVLAAGDIPLRAHEMLAALAAPPIVTDRRPLVTVREEAWAVTGEGHSGATEQPSAAHALVASRSGGILHALAEPPVAVGSL